MTSTAINSNFSSRARGTRRVTGATTVQSDANPLFAYDLTKPLIVSVAFGGTRVDLAMYGSGGGGVTLETGALFHFDGADAATTTVDSSGNSHAMTLTTADLDNAQSKFGGTALHILSSGSLYELDGSADFAFGTGDFTIDFWVLLSSTSGTRVLYYSGAAYTTAGAYPGIRNVSGTGLLYTVGNTAVITGTGLVFNTWYHIAVTRASGVTRMFVDGVQQGSDYTDSNNYIVAANRPACTAFNGWMDELHVVKGRAEWTANFTPRALPWAGEGEVNTATMLGKRPSSLTAGPSAAAERLSSRPCRNPHGQRHMDEARQAQVARGREPYQCARGPCVA